MQLARGEWKERQQDCVYICQSLFVSVVGMATVSEPFNLTPSLTKPRQQRVWRVGRHETTALMNKTVKLYVQNTVWLVSPPSSAKQQRRMSICQDF